MRYRILTTTLIVFLLFLYVVIFLNIDNKNFFHILLLIVSSITTLFVSTKIEKALVEQKDKETRKIKKLQTINSFYTLLESTDGVKNVCDVSLRFLCKILKCHSALLYISNEKNHELQLTSGQGKSIENIPKILDTYKGILGKCFLSKKTIYNHNKGICEIYIPLLFKNKTIAIIKLEFLKKMEGLNLDNNQKAILKIITNNIIKELEIEQNKKYFNLIDKNVLISSTNIEGDITFVSEAFCKKTGYTKSELLGENHRIIKDPEVKNKVFDSLWSTITQGKIWTHEVPNIKKDGKRYWAKTIITPEFDYFGNIVGYDAIRQDITDKKTIEKISITDALTSIYNRRYFDKIFPTKLSLAKRFTQNLCFGLIDIDHFKQYNDTYGHQKGDDVLKDVAQCLKNTLQRENDYVFRLGGEEFGVLFFVNEDNNALKMGNKIVKNIENLQIEHSKNSASKFITISMGIYIYSNQEVSSNDIYKTADEYLYKAKQNGKNQVYINIKEKND